jgi:hypothetical protein
VTAATSLATDPRSKAIRAAWGRYLVVLAGVGLVVLVVIIAIWPWPYAFVVERFILPEYEVSFGFRGGRLPVSMGDSSYTLYALLEVSPDGKLAHAGARSGDIPIGYHGGLWAFYGALEEARAGREGHFDVVSHSDWPDRDKRRKLTIGPEGETTPR